MTVQVHDPDILILDEPVSGLDPNQIVEIRELIKSLGKEKTVVISSHILHEIEATVDRIVIIHQGGIVADGTSQELMSSFRGQTRLNLVVKYAADESVQQLAQLVPDIHLAEASVQNGSRSLTIEYAKELDPRESIFNFAKQNGWVILEMSQDAVHLEDVFRNLTTEGGPNG